MEITGSVVTGLNWSASALDRHFADGITPQAWAKSVMELQTQHEIDYRDASGFQSMRSWSDAVDALIRRVYTFCLDEASLTHSSVREGVLSGGLAIAALGGYGRREMAPYSDVDVAFVAGSDESESVDLVVKLAFRRLMDTLDIAGMKVGYSYRRVDDVENLDFETHTALLDARILSGSRLLFDRFQTALRKNTMAAQFVMKHVQCRLNAPAFETPYVVEPNVKESCGGLRDIQTARWISQASFSINGTNVWEGLRARGIIADADIALTNSAIDFVAKTRHFLHYITGQPSELLSGERQRQIAEAMGFRNAAGEPDGQSFIATYYGHAKNIRYILRKIADACLEEDLVLEPGVITSKGYLRILDAGLLVRDECAVLRIFQYLETYSLKIDRASRDLISGSSKGYKLTPSGSAVFLSLLSGPGFAKALRSMTELGVLQSIIPQFAELMVVIPGDSAHRYTVGEHSLQTVDQLESLLGSDDEILGDVFSRIQNLDVLFLAALLHDIGKADCKRDHAKTGAPRAAKLARMLGLDEESSRKVEFLVKNHLKMSETARLRDLNQRKTIKDFVGFVKDIQLLDMLLLLTVADSRAVGSRHWNKVQMRFLMELHERAISMLRTPEAAGADVDRHRKRVRRELCLANLPYEEVDAHCALMPARYLLNTSPEDLAAHIGYVRQVIAGSPSVDMKDDRGGDYTRLTIFAKDRSGLMSDITGVFRALGMNIHAAQIYTRRAATDSHDYDIAIDTLYVDFEGRQLTEVKKWQVEGELMSVLSCNETVDDLLARWQKKDRVRLENVEVFLHDDLSELESVVEIRANDVAGLLHHLTRKLAKQEWEIHSARVATWAGKARDAFYVTTKNGEKLTTQQVESFKSSLTDQDS